MLDKQSLTDILMCVTTGELDIDEAHEMISEQVGTRDQAIDLIAGTLIDMDKRLKTLEEYLKPPPAVKPFVTKKMIIARMEQTGEDWETARENLNRREDEKTQ